jgi:isochorismate pyruvate lyase
MKEANECANIPENLTEIDRIDSEIIAALSKRFKYVKAPEKFQAMLEQWRTWAEK